MFLRIWPFSGSNDLKMFLNFSPSIFFYYVILRHNVILYAHFSKRHIKIDKNKFFIQNFMNHLKNVSTILKKNFGSSTI